MRARKHAAGRGVHRGAGCGPVRGSRRDGRGPLRARGGARRRRRRRAGPSSSRSTTRRSRRSRPPATPPRRCTRIRRRSATTRPRCRSAVSSDGDDPAVRARIAEKLGDVALRLGRVDQATEVWEECLDFHRRQEDLARVGDLHRKIGAGLWHKGDREGSIEHYQKGIDLLKDGPPCLELVRLYEEAASLYMHTGRQHARHLRVREGAAPRRAARRGRRREPRARDLRPRVRPDRRLRASPPEPRALGRAGPRVRPRRGGPRPAHPRATTSRSPRPTTRAPAPRTARRSSSPSRPATCRRRSSCTPRSPSSPPTAVTGRSSPRRPRRPGASPSARA